MSTGRAALALLVLTALLAGPAAAGDPSRYYVVYFGSEKGPLRPRYTHTWATYVRVTPDARGGVCVEPHTVSWLPASGVVRVWPWFREPGANYTLAESFAYAAANGERVRVWGPFEIDAGRFAAAVAQRARLEAGRDYRPVDATRRPGVNNCLTAILDADPRTAGAANPTLSVGFRGTAAIVRDQAVHGAFRAGPPDTAWLLPALGVPARR